MSFEPENLDPFERLAIGDKVYYKNFRNNETQRWIEAKYIKRLSKTMFQIAIGSHPVSAHKGQLMVPARTERRRVALQSVSRRGTKRRWEDSEEDVEPPLLNSSFEAPPPSRSEIHPDALLPSSMFNSTNSEQHDRPIIRRSARTKKKKIDSSFVYF